MVAILDRRRSSSASSTRVLNETRRHNLTKAHELFPNVPAGGMAHDVIGYKWDGPAGSSPKNGEMLGHVSALLRKRL